MRRLAIMMGLWLGVWLPGAHGGTYALADGTQITGEPSTYREEGVVLKTGESSYTARMPWGSFTDAALQQLLADAPNAQAREVLEPMVENLPEQKAKFREIVVKPIETPSAPAGHLGLLAIFSSSLGWAILLILYGANLFAAYEVAIFRNQPAATVCGVAAIPFFGVAGPIIFLLMPKGHRAGAETTAHSAEPAAEPVSEPVPPRSGRPRVPAAESVPEPAAEPSGGVPAAAAAGWVPAGAGWPEPVVYQRGDFSFNRRFFETKLTGFFRVVPSEADRDLVVQITASRGQFIGKRITRITQTELYLQVFAENVSADEMIPFLEIQEVRVRHKDVA